MYYEPLGKNRCIKLTKAGRFLVCVQIFPGPENSQTSPSPEAIVENIPFEALRI